MSKEGIIIHCSDSEFGSSIEIDRWHRERSWNNIGYNFVICNGQIENNNYLHCMDGAIERGRDIDNSGAHAKGYNHYIGICLIGKTEFSDAQSKSLQRLIAELKEIHNIEDKNILGHYEVSSKTCPNFNVEHFINYNKILDLDNAV